MIATQTLNQLFLGFLMARMKILNSHEEAEFESPPKFNSAERKRFFSVSRLILGEP